MAWNQPLPRLGRCTPVVFAVVCLLGSQARGQEAQRLDLYGDPLPQRGLVRLGTQRFRGAGESLAISPDGKTIAAVGSSVRLFDAATGAVLKDIPFASDNYTRQIAYSQDGKRLALIGGLRVPGEQRLRGCLRLWEAASGAELATILWEEAREAKFVTFLPDGATVLTGSTDGTLRFWDLEIQQRRLTYKLPFQMMEMQDMAVSADGSLIAGVSRGPRGGIYLWNCLQQGEPRLIPMGDRAAISAAFSPDGALLATGHDVYGGQEGLSLWDVATGQKLRAFRSSQPMHYLRQVGFTPDGRLLASINYANESIMLWDVASGEEVRTLFAAPVKPMSLAISADSKWVAASGWEGVVRLWDTATGTLLDKAAEAHQSGVTRLQFTPDGDRMVTSSEDGTVRVWDSHSGRQLSRSEHQRRPGRSNWARGLAVSPDGKLLASSSLDDTVRLWNASDGKQIYRLAGHGELGGRRSLAFFSDGKRFASWGDDMYLRIWSAANGKALAEHKIRPAGIPINDDEAEDAGRFEGWRMSLNAGEFAPDGKRFVLALGNAMYLYEVESGRELGKIDSETGQVYWLSFSDDGQFLITTGRFQPPNAEGEHTVIRVLEVATGKVVHELVVPDWAWATLALSPDNTLLAIPVRGQPAAIRIWDLPQARELGLLEGVPSTVRGLTFSPDGRRLASALGDTTVLIWDLQGIVAP
jgi:WD40 repeat protein